MLLHAAILYLFVILFSVQYMEKRFALETRESFLIKSSEHKNQHVCFIVHFVKISLFFSLSIFPAFFILFFVLSFVLVVVR